MNAFTNSTWTTRRSALAIVIAWAALAPGCASPTAPPRPPSGGSSLSLDYTRFVTTVEPVLHRQGCDAGGDCHGGGPRGAFALSPAGAKDMQLDFQQASEQVNPVTPDSSRLLTKPLALAAGGVPHAVKVFSSTSDSDYVTLRGWILAGVTR